MFNFKVSKGNSKLGNIYNINLPAIVTCAVDAPCKGTCYACKGFYRMPTVKTCYDNNLKSFLLNSLKAGQDILSQLPDNGNAYCRIHSSGDFFNMEYLDMIVAIANNRKNIKFLAFTKKYSLINRYMEIHHELPENLKIVFSGWKDYPMENPNNFPTSWVMEESDNRLNMEAFPCAGHCENCYLCWKLLGGEQVYFHKH